MFDASLSPAITYGLFVVLGLVFGSFSNVVLARMPSGKSLRGRSRCPHCNKVIGIGELIPVISYLLLRGKCSGCHKRISPQYPLMELSAAIIFAGAVWFTGGNIVAGLCLGIALLAITVIALIDLRTMLIPDLLTAVVVVAALGYQYAFVGSITISGAVLAAVFLGTQWLLSRGKWVGSGDVLLAGALGLLVGTWRMAMVMLMLSYIVGAAIVIILLALHMLDRTKPIPFGPLLSLGALITLVFGSQLSPVLFPF